MRRQKSHASDQPSTPKLRLHWMLGAAPVLLGAGPGQVVAGNLPVPCVSAGACGANGPSAWVASGNASYVQSGNQMTISQQSPNATLNWQSFNIGAGNQVSFNQPSSSSVALNQIFQGSPSQIFGALTANGRVYLLNQNGIVFGPDAQVNTATLLATSLNISPDALLKGLAQAALDGFPALQPYTDAQGNVLPSGGITVMPGASINAPGGQVMLFAPEVTNLGNISTPDGQTILGAGQRVFLLTSSDPSLRGLLVEVGLGGTVTNGEASNAGQSAADLVGVISADRGNVTLAGLAVNQLGRISATTSTVANGSILLEASDAGSAATLSSPGNLQPVNAGSVTLGPNSITSVTPYTAGTDKAVDATVQPLSSVTINGATIDIESAAQVIATAGTVTAVASTNPTATSSSEITGTPDSSRLIVAANAVIDVSGDTVSLPVSDNVIAVQLRGTELADDPLQRTGPLDGATVYVDVRQTGTNANGTTWQGTPLANVSGYISAIERGVGERSLTGGTISLASQGSMIISPGATLNVSGGQIDWQGGYINTSKLLATNGQEYDISQASPNLRYVGVVNPNPTVTDPHWGVTENLPAPGAAQGQYQAGYVQGADAGLVQLVAPQLILDGNILGKTVTGPLQRQPPGTLTGLLRPSDQAPLGATLEIGTAGSTSPPDSVEGNVDITAGLVLPGLEGPGGAAFDPLTDPWPASVTSVRVRPDLLGPDGVSNLLIYANGTIDLPAGTPLNLPAGGSLELTGGQVLLSSSVSVPSGSIVLDARTASQTSVAPLVSLGDGVEVSAAGQWVNDALALQTGTAEAPLDINGGLISVAAPGGIALGAGSVLDVSGGAQLTSSQTVTAGSAGSISLAVSNPGAQISGLAGTQLRGYGLTEGGSLSLSANSICISLSGCGADASVSALNLSPQFFSQGGFASYSVASTLAGLELAGDSTITLEQSNWRLLGSSIAAASGTPMTAITTAVTLPDGVRAPSSLSLSALDAGGGPPTPPNLVLDTGSSIVADPDSRISLHADGLIILDGLVSAPGGSVSVLLDNSLNETAYQPNQGIWLGPSASIDVSGTFVGNPSSVPGVVTGTVLPGGSVSVVAQRGFIVDLQGSSIDASGTSAQVDTSYGGQSYVSQDVPSAGGSITLQAAEGMLLSGSLSARSGDPSTVAGGSLTVIMDGTKRIDNDEIFPGGTREVLVTEAPIPEIVEPGTAIPLTLDGVAAVPVSTVNAGGFDSLTLEARNVSGSDVLGNPVFVGYGEVAFDPGVALELRGSLTVNAPQIGLAGAGVATVGSAYVSIGSTDPTQTAPPPTGGAGTLNIDGGFIDLTGHVSFTGMSSLNINSASDLRLIGIFPPGQSVDTGYVGELDAATNVSLSAQQIYPATLSSYLVNVTGTGTLTVGAAPGTPSTALSAGGVLEIDAPTITVGGALRAPDGALVLNANSIEVLAGGTLSTASTAPLTLFGQTQGGTTWTYPTAENFTNVYGVGGQPLPVKTISLNAPSVALDKGSTLDVSGGGDLLAYEFVPGPGGTQDVLSAQVNPNLYAIVPTLDLGIAPYDPGADTGFSLAPGTSVYLAGAPSLGLAAGTYALLPARYALLPGSFLVQPVSGYQNIPLTQSVPQLNGSVVVAGYEVMTGAGRLSGETSGFDIFPGTEALTLAPYTLTTANSFFSAQAEAAGVPTPRLPEDAGVVSIAADQSLTLAGTLAANKASSAQGAELDISAPNIAVTSGSSAAPAGFLAIPASELTSFGAETLVLGAARENTAQGVALLPTANVVEVESGVTLDAPQIDLLGRSAVDLDPGSTVTASGAVVSAPVTGAVSGAAATAVNSVLVDGGAAFVEVSTGAPVIVQRIGDTSTPGALNFSSTAVLGSSGSVSLDAPGSATIDGTFAVSGGALALGAPSISLGNAPAGTAGLVLDPGKLSALSLGQLVLNGSQGIDLYGTFTLQTKELTLDTPSVIAADPNTAATLNVGNLTLEGSATGPLTAGPVSGGSVSFSGQQATLAGGNTSFAGFATTTLALTGPIEAQAGGTLSASGDLALGASVITPASGQDSDFVAGNNITLTSLAASSGAPAAPASLGGGLRFTAGGGIGDSGNLVAPAGLVQMVAAGPAGIAMTSGASIDVSGRIVSSNGVSIGAPGGTVSLEADAGSIALGAGTTINVSGTTSSAGGDLELLAPNGSLTVAATLNGAAGSAVAGGSAEVLANAFDFDAVRGALTAGGFTGSWDLHLLGPGDLVLAAGETITASSVTLTADQGAISIGGTVNASAPRGGAVTLAADGLIAVSGTIDAQGTDAGVRGGDVQLESSTGVVLNAGSVIDVGGNGVSDPALTPGGTVTIQVPQSAVLAVASAGGPSGSLALSGSIQGARQVSLVGEATYQAAGGVIDSTDVLADPSNPWYAGAASFVQQGAAALGLLGHGTDPTYVLQPGIIVTSAGDLQVDAPWILSGWQFNGQPGILTLRAAGNLLVNASISDGFTDLTPGSTGFVLPTTSWNSWSYQLVAGADLNSANLMATVGPWSGASLGSVMLAPGTAATGGGGRGGGGGGAPTLIRTGTGDIAIAAAGDLDLGNQASVIYTAGIAGPGIELTGRLGTGALNLGYPTDGGDISIAVGGDINGALSNQFYSEWLFRTGQAASDPRPRATAWTVDFADFNQGVATLGGGSISITAGGDITNLDVSTPSIGRQVGGTTAQANEVQIVGGGDLRVSAGGDILGGEFYSDNGVSSITAGGQIGTATLPDGTAVAPILALGAGSLEVISRQAGAIETVVNPTLLPVSASAAQSGAPSNSFFSTYTDSSSVAVIAVGGPLRFMGGTDAGSAVADELANEYASAPGSDVPFRILPPNVEAAALADSLTVGGAFSTWSAPRANLTLFAENSIYLQPVQASAGYDIVFSDADPVNTLPTPANPSGSTAFIGILGSAAGTVPGFDAATPVHDGSGGPDPTPVEIIAATGNIIDQLNATTEGDIYLSKPVVIAAGGNIENLNIRVQNLTPASVSSITAGGNITYPIERDQYGEVVSNSHGIVIDGPGQLEVIAGGTIDLGTSNGILSEGDLRNPALPANGATINVAAGAAPESWNTAAFISSYLAPSGQYDAALVAYVNQLDPSADTATHADAVAAFEALSADAQRGFIEQVLFTELQESGVAAAGPGAAHDNFTQGFDALNTLFPGSVPAAGKTNPYDGSINLFFSQIYTLSGGSVNLLAPGGGVNVGLAIPPVSFGVTKPPSQLGVVAEQAGSVNAAVYNDFEVNASRVFAADGGDILIWSSDGNIDAGRGAKTAISSPPPTITYNADGTPNVSFPAALTGSGIQALATTAGVSPGSVFLFAPNGVVNANDAGIVAGNLTIAATAVLGANNITVSGTAVGLPQPPPALGASLSSASSAAAGTTNTATSAMSGGESNKSTTPLSDQALSWLDVFVVGFGEEVCRPEDTACLERQRHSEPK